MGGEGRTLQAIAVLADCLRLSRHCYIGIYPKPAASFVKENTDESRFRFGKSACRSVTFFGGLRGHALQFGLAQVGCQGRSMHTPCCRG